MRKRVGIIIGIGTIASFYIVKYFKGIKFNEKDESLRTQSHKIKVTHQNKLNFHPDKKETNVYLVGNGSKYHLDKNCRGIKRGSQLKEISLNEAKEKGYSLCKWES